MCTGSGRRRFGNGPTLAKTEHGAPATNYVPVKWRDGIMLRGGHTMRNSSRSLGHPPASQFQWHYSRGCEHSAMVSGCFIRRRARLSIPATRSNATFGQRQRNSESRWMGGWHDLRHTLATSLRKRGYSPKVISELVGHSSVQITENIYDHADRADFRAALGEMASELLPSVTKLAVVN